MAVVTPDPAAVTKARTVCLGQNFGMAFCEHFGLPSRQVLTVAPHADRDEILHAKVEIALTAEDLEAIAKLMGAAAVNRIVPDAQR